MLPHKPTTKSEQSKKEHPSNCNLDVGQLARHCKTREGLQATHQLFHSEKICFLAPSKLHQVVFQSTFFSSETKELSDTPQATYRVNTPLNFTLTHYANFLDQYRSTNCVTDSLQQCSESLENLYHDIYWIWKRLLGRSDPKNKQLANKLTHLTLDFFNYPLPQEFTVFEIIKDFYQQSNKFKIATMDRSVRELAAILEYAKKRIQSMAFWADFLKNEDLESNGGYNQKNQEQLLNFGRLATDFGVIILLQHQLPQSNDTCEDFLIQKLSCYTENALYRGGRAEIKIFDFKPLILESKFDGMIKPQASLECLYKLTDHLKVLGEESISPLFIQKDEFFENLDQTPSTCRPVQKLKETASYDNTCVVQGSSISNFNYEHESSPVSEILISNISVAFDVNIPSIGIGESLTCTRHSFLIEDSWAPPGTKTNQDASALLAILLKQKIVILGFETFQGSIPRFRLYKKIHNRFKNLLGLANKTLPDWIDFCKNVLNNGNNVIWLTKSQNECEAIFAHFFDKDSGAPVSQIPSQTTFFEIKYPSFSNETRENFPNKISNEGFQKKTSTLSVTEFSLFVECPAKYYFTHIAGLKSADFEKSQTHKLTQGTQNHSLLEHFFTRFRMFEFSTDQALTFLHAFSLAMRSPEALISSSSIEWCNWIISELLKNSLPNSISHEILHTGILEIADDIFLNYTEGVDPFDQQVNDKIGKNLELEKRLAIETSKRILIRAVEIELVRFRTWPDYVPVVHTELPFEFDLGPISVRGRIDRVDKIDGKFALLDYKISTPKEGRNNLTLSPKTVTSTTPLSVQGALYSLALEKMQSNHLNHSKILDSETTTYSTSGALHSFSLFRLKTLNDAVSSVSSVHFPNSRSEYDTCLSDLLEEYKNIGHSFQQNHFTKLPAHKSYCQWCQFLRLCKPQFLEKREKSSTESIVDEDHQP